MDNIPILLDDLRKNGWHIAAFPFKYKTVNYTVLFEDLSNLSKSKEPYTVLLTFIDCKDDSRILRVRASKYSFKLCAKTFRNFFGIEWSSNLGNIFQQFYAHFNGFIPKSIPLHYNEITKRQMLNQLSQNDHENPNNLCCYAIKRNGIHDGKQYLRSPFNSDKTKLLRKSLYDLLGNDNTISFCYRESNPLSDAEICAQFSKNHDFI